MSYCRWSSEDFSCDLYCYESCLGGWTTHVGNQRIVGNVPHVEYLHDVETYITQNKAQSEFLKTCKHMPIGLPYDGQTLCDDTLEEFRETLIHLKELGYQFPKNVLLCVEEEIEDRQILPDAAARHRPPEVPGE